MKLTQLSLNGHDICMHEKGQNGPFLIHGVHANVQEECERIATLITRYAPGKAFTLVTFSCRSWNGDYSPWAADVESREPFSGQGRDTLAFLETELLPSLAVGERPVFIGGYSLSGLFALWALYESDLFSGAAACSASLWYPCWDGFAQSHHPKHPALLYLSLGEKEEKTRHPLMCRVGDAMRTQDALAEADPMILAHTLVMHPGGHGTEGDIRMAKGFAWLLEHAQ